MKQLPLNLSVMACGIAFMAIAASAKPYWQPIEGGLSLSAMAAAIICAAPLFIAFFLIVRAHKALRQDEYLQHQLSVRTMYASLTTLGWIAIVGFLGTAQPSIEGADVSYASYIMFWCLVWGIAGLMKFGEIK